MSWSYWFVDTVTGVKQLQVSPSEGGWERVLNGKGSGAHVFQLGDRTLSRATWRALTTPWARTLVVCRNNVPVYAGLVSDRPYDRDTKTLTINHVDIRGILNDRFPFGVTSYHGGTLVLTNLSMRSAAGRLVQAGLTGPRPIYALPIVLPTLVETGAYSHTYFAHNFITVADALEDLQKIDGGPDVDFAPRWSSTGTLEYVMRTGTTAAPLLTGATFDFPMNGEKEPLTGLKLNDDGTNQVTGVYAIGQGSGEDMVVGGIPAGTELPAVIPARETTQSFKDVNNEPEASKFSVSASAALHGTTEQWSFEYVIDEGLARVENMTLGSTLRLNFDDDEWIEDGWTDLRLVGLSGDMTETVTPTVQGGA